MNNCNISIPNFYHQNELFNFKIVHLSELSTIYTDVIMSAVVSQITGVYIVYSAICPCVDQRKHHRSASLDFVRGIDRWPVNSPHKGTVTRQMFPFDDVIMLSWFLLPCLHWVSCMALWHEGWWQSVTVRLTSVLYLYLESLYLERRCLYWNGNQMSSIYRAQSTILGMTPVRSSLYEKEYWIVAIAIWCWWQGL